MKKLVLMLATLAFTKIALAQSASVEVILNPMGDFKGTTAVVKGFATQKGDEVVAENIIVNLKALKTGLALRDKHTQKYLETSKYPEAVLLSARGKGGKGVGKIKIRGIEKDISGTYKITGKKLQAKFKLNLSEFGIKDISYTGVGVEDEVTVTVVVPVK